MGESGVGKSTLLNLLAGLDRTDSGRVLLEGIDLATLDDDAATLLRRRAVGFVFQAFHVLPYLSVEQNVSLPLDLLGIGEPERGERTREMLRAVGIEALARRHARELSGGEIQRVAIARALVHRPRLVLADEPTGNLDTRSAAQILALLRAQVKANGGAGILITHSRMAADTADRILVLDARGLHAVEAALGERPARSACGECCCWPKYVSSRHDLLVTVLALALGVALGSSVYWVNTSALNEFGLATKRLVGEADIVIRGPREGFPEQVFVDLARNAAVSAVSPVLELEVALAGPQRHAQSAGPGSFPGRSLAAHPHWRYRRRRLSAIRAGRHLLEQRRRAGAASFSRGDPLPVTVGSSSKTLRVLGILPEGAYPQPLGLMDIASAQWTFNALGRVNRIDLRLMPGTDVDALRRELGKAPAAGRSCHCAAGRTRSGGQRDPRLSSESEHAGVGRAVHRRFLGVLHTIALGAAATPITGLVARAGRHAEPVASRPARRGIGARRRRVAARRDARRCSSRPRY